MIADGWVDWATRVPGMRQDKIYPQPNQALGLVWHSQEGRGLTAMRNIHQADSPPSFMFWLDYAGGLHQFSPVTASVWCSGNALANISWWPVELEGFEHEPINLEQERTALRLIAEWEAHTGLVAERRVTLWEHREVAQIATPNAGPTACPSERYAPLWAAMEEDHLGLAEDVALIKAALGATGVTQAYIEGIDLLESVRNTQIAQQEHIDNHPGGSGAVPVHQHTGEVTVT